MGEKDRYSKLRAELRNRNEPNTSVLAKRWARGGDTVNSESLLTHGVLSKDLPRIRQKVLIYL
jgi:hypothetical protein